MVLVNGLNGKPWPGHQRKLLPIENSHTCPGVSCLSERLPGWPHTGPDSHSTESIQSLDLFYARTGVSPIDRRGNRGLEKDSSPPRVTQLPGLGDIVTFCLDLLLLRSRSNGTLSSFQESK